MFHGGETLTKNGTYIKQTVYQDGVKICDGDYSLANWDHYVKNDLPSSHYFEIGRATMSTKNNWCYSKLNAYFLRLYSKALDAEKVNTNYTETTDYHQKLANPAV